VLRWGAGSDCAEGSLPYEGGATIFADTRYAYRCLSESEQRWADYAEVVYAKGGVFGRTSVDVQGRSWPRMSASGLRPTARARIHASKPPLEQLYDTTDEDADTSGYEASVAWRGSGEAQSIHPLVWRHPATGAPAVMAHTLILDCVKVRERADEGGQGRGSCRHRQLSWEESQEVVAAMLAPCTRPDRVYRHNWAPGDLVIWDNYRAFHTITEWQTCHLRNISMATGTPN
jgi:alpha-ketoglutarate-dependent taurine dioxygenase